jgi:hypothetical protein
MHTTTVRTPLEIRSRLHFEVDGLQVWAAHLDAKGNGQFGVRFLWMENRYDCSPAHHLTCDDGQTFQQFESFLAPVTGSLDMHITMQESDPVRLTRLQNIWFAYLLELSRERRSSLSEAQR